MQFTCDREVLLYALQTAARGSAGRRGTLPVLSGIHFSLSDGELTVRGTDLEVWIESTIAVDVSDIGAPIVVPARLVSEVVRSLPAGPVTVSSDDESSSVEVSAPPRSKFSLKTLSAGDFPERQSLAAAAVVVEASELSDAFDQVVFAASTDDARAILTAVCLSSDGGVVRAVSTDSYRLALRTLDVDDLVEGSVLLPARSLGEVRRVIDSFGPDEKMTVQFSERHAVFTIGQTTVGTRLLEGEYPNWSRLVENAESSSFVVDRLSMLDAARRLRVMESGSTPIRMKLGSDGAEMSVVATDVGDGCEPVDGVFDGEPMEIAFTIGYLMDGLAALKGDMVRMQVRSAQRPVVMTAEGDDSYLYLLMPVRV